MPSYSTAAREGNRLTASEPPLRTYHYRSSIIQTFVVKTIDAIQITPVFSGADNLQWDDHDVPYHNEAVDSYIPPQFADQVNYKYPVVDYILAVYGFHKDDLKAPSGGYKLPLGPVLRYIANGYDNHGVERAAYIPLRMIFEYVTKQVTEAMGTCGTGVHVVDVDDRQPHGDFVSRKPDFVWSWTSQENVQLWAATALSGELKKKKGDELHFVTDVDLSKIPELTFKDRATGEAEPSEATTATMDTGPSAPSPSIASTPKTEKSRKADSVLSSKTSHSSGKPESRPHGEDGSPPFTVLTEYEVQAVRYLNELGSHGLRSYATGFLIEDYKMTLWYIDRMGVVQSSSFNFLREPHYLVLFIAAVTSASMKQLGYFPHLVFPTTPGITAETMQTYQGVTLTLPVDNALLPGSLCSFPLDVSKDRPLIPTYDAVGRATMVVPVVEHTKSTERRCEKDKLMVKISWQWQWRCGEDNNIHAVRTKLANDPARRIFLQNVIKLRHSWTFTMAEMDLPRAEMFDLLPVDERVCRVLILDEYLPLQEVQSAEAFKKIFVDVVKAHRAVYESSGILHGDISATNIMFYYGEEREGEIPAIGVLCDWDFGKEALYPGEDAIVEDLLNSQLRPEQMMQLPLQHSSEWAADVDTDLKKTLPRIRTGTGPFIALDLLLYRQLPNHLYRHDLESFFWVLVWFVTSFDPENANVMGISAWLNPDFSKIGDEKAKFLQMRSDWLDITQYIHAAYVNLCNTWVRKLRSSLIIPVFEKYLKYQLRMDGRLENAQMGLSEETVEDVMRDVKNLVVKREAILTYETFMKAIDAEP